MGEVIAVGGMSPRTTRYHYSPATRIGDLILVSGQVGVGPDGEVVGSDFLSQAHQLFANLRDVLQLAGNDLAKVAKVTVYLTDVADFPQLVELREVYFSPPYPADTTVVVASLARPDLLLEIDAIATL